MTSSWAKARGLSIIAVFLVAPSAAGLAWALSDDSVALGDTEPRMGTTGFAVFGEPPLAVDELPDAEAGAVRALGDGYAASAERGGTFSGGQRGASEDGRAIGEGRGAVHRVSHSSGTTVVLVRQGSSLCTLEVREGGGGCGPSDLDATAPPVSVTDEGDGQRVMALLPDGVRDVQITDVSGDAVTVTVERNVAVGRTTRARAITWVDSDGAAQRVTFLSTAADPAEEALSRSRELKEAVGR